MAEMYDIHRMMEAVAGIMYQYEVICSSHDPS